MRFSNSHDHWFSTALIFRVPRADIRIPFLNIETNGMLSRIIVIDLAAGIVLFACWFGLFVRSNRRRAVQILGWVDRALDGRGEIIDSTWLSTSRFRLRLRLLTSVFRQCSITVQLSPRELPVQWLIYHLSKRPETLTFDADLDCPPSFNLEVHNHRWCGRTRRHFPRTSENWVMHRGGPFVITTRNDWQREITNMMNALVVSRDSDCTTVCFRRASPHFSVTVPLETIRPGSGSETNLFTVLRDLATGASASRF